MNTCSRHLGLLVHDRLYADQLNRLVYHELLVGLENMLTCCLVVVVEMAETHWIEMELEEGHKYVMRLHTSTGMGSLNGSLRMKEANTGAESCSCFNSYLYWM